MPPKKQQQTSKKTELKKKEKVIEDKTFGLKNKKGNKQQKFIAQVEHQVKNSGQTKARLEAEKHAKTKVVDDLADLNKLLKPVQNMPKVSKDVDPKSVLCVFFKQGLCTKGGKCKFSHDLSVEHRAAKRNVYVDSRDVGEDNMENWDEAKLNEVVQKKHGEADKLKPKTAIICKFFLEALENNKYGWFWDCPNGETCIYKHALPPGYVLKKDKKKLDEFKEDEISLEDLIEKERAALGSNLTRITLETFLEWKKRKVREKKSKKAAAESKKKNEYKAGRAAGLSGKDLFTFNPDLVTQDDEEADDTRYQREPQENEDEYDNAVEIDESMFDIDEDGEISEFSGGQTETPPVIQNGVGSSQNNGAVKFNEDLFDPDDIPDSDLDDDEDDTPGPSGITKGIENVALNGDNT